MGILNVTSDSFSDGGLFADRDRAVAHGMKMLEDGADIIDVGGESTRPGSTRVDAEEEIRRVVPVIGEICRKSGAAVSVDTMKAEVALRALDAGACIVNDVSAMTHDPEMKKVVGQCGAGAVLMHMLGTPENMQENPQYSDVVAEVLHYLEKRVSDLVAQGLELETLAIDPGIGFGKTVEHNCSLIQGLQELVETGRPVVVGLSRKSFIGKITGCTVEDRLPGSLAGLSACVLKGAGVMRVHDVKESRQAMMIAAALRERGD